MKSQDEPIILGEPGQKNKSWWNKILKWFSENRNTVITLIVVVLAIAGAIYLSQRSQIAKREEGLKKSTEEQVDTQISQSEQKTDQKFEEIKKGEEVKEERKVTESEIVEKAVKGDGITHLARKALTTYLEKNPEIAKELTKEHKIYIEDYLKDIKVAERGRKKMLVVGEEVSFSNDLIKQAIESSKKLPESQLKQIQSKYSPLVKSL